MPAARAGLDAAATNVLPPVKNRQEKSSYPTGKKFISKKKTVRIQRPRSRKKEGKCADKIGIDRNKVAQRSRNRLRRDDGFAGAQARPDA
jgi:hypothetical protein